MASMNRKKHEATSGRGGARKGAGRKSAGPTESISLRIPVELLERIDQLPGTRTETIIQVLNKSL